MAHVVCHHGEARKGNENVVGLVFEIQQHINLQYEKKYFIIIFFCSVEKKVLFFSYWETKKVLGKED